MSHEDALPPVRHSILVDAPIARAFSVFTDGFDRWWPREHHIGKSPLKKSVLEAKAGGRCYEIGEDGSECDWGKVRVWEPPGRVVIAWHLNASWQFDPDPERASEVDVRFVAEPGDRTRVELEHRHIERHGAGAEGIHKSVGSDGGWPTIMKGFAAAASG